MDLVNLPGRHFLPIWECVCIFTPHALHLLLELITNYYYNYYHTIIIIIITCIIIIIKELLARELVLWEPLHGHRK